MYYSSGTYELFAHPEKPEGVDNKSAYIIGTGLAGLTAAFYLVRDGQMKGENIHLLEKLELAGGSCDGRKDITKGFFMRGGREMDNHFEIMWDVFRDVPSIETPDVSVLDEYYWLNKHDPNYSMCRATVKCGEDAHTDKKFNLDKKSAMALSHLFITPEKKLEGKKISDVLPEEFWSTNFWLYWQTMFAFQKWSSALEMKRYLCRYVHHIDGLPDFSALRFTKYNQFESMIMPLVKYLSDHGVKIEYGIDVKNVIIETVGDKKVASQIMDICKRDPRSGKVTTGGIVTVKDSVDDWYLSWTINRQPQFKSQDKDKVLVWLYALHTDRPGTYVNKPMRECTGEEVCREWLYHIGVHSGEIEKLAAEACNTTTCFMPYINAFFQPRKNEDRPHVVPEGAVNFAFLGQFAETPRDTIFTTEYSMRTGMEAVYTLLNVDRGVPEVWGSKYDVRQLLRAAYYAIDKKSVNEIKMSLKEKAMLAVVMNKVKGTDLEILLKDSGLIK